MWAASLPSLPTNPEDCICTTSMSTSWDITAWPWAFRVSAPAMRFVFKPRPASSVFMCMGATHSCRRPGLRRTRWSVKRWRSRPSSTAIQTSRSCPPISANFHSKRQHQPAGTVDGWKKELQVYARKLVYKGPVSSFDLSTLPNWPTNPSGLDADSAYVEFRRIFDEVTILCKPWSQCVHPAEQKPGPPVADGVNYRSTTQRASR